MCAAGEGNSCASLCLSLRFHGAGCFLRCLSFADEAVAALPFAIFRRLSPWYCCCDRSRLAGASTYAGTTTRFTTSTCTRRSPSGTTR